MKFPRAPPIYIFPFAVFSLLSPSNKIFCSSAASTQQLFTRKFYLKALPMEIYIPL
jgi:hypothetical protein